MAVRQVQSVPPSSIRELAVTDSFRLVGVLPQSSAAILVVVFVIALEPHHLAVSLEGENVVAIRSRNQRSWLMTAQPGKASKASSRARKVSTSRSFVGSSRSSKLPPRLSSLAR